ncbi:AT-rich interactive domain-containing protein 4B isoform X2 [Eupeodes corollae]|uniref:AT-rich interactive domain-containing protein 4B isoform X2 n=1 Tax=Eupeodes corollae TaxID=290404 RepID=UPI00248F5F78|nr:AT-rich interactive domain-containing protein 4B isoform X2 [Eupeodes corollae]
MGKRIAPEQQAVTAGRKRKRVCNDFQQQDTTKSEQVKWAGDSSSSPKSSPPQTPTETKNKQLAVLNASFDDNSPQPVYHLRQSMVSGIVLEDLTAKKWRLGKPIGKGNFGEIFLASDNVSVPVTSENAEYVVKIEPHSNGPLFVEIHCLLNTAKKNDENPLPPGMPEYIASGSHYFGENRYRFLVIKRFDRDLHSLIKNRRITQKSVLTLALQILDVLQHLHDKGYCHNDIKAQNLMISKCTYRKSHLIYGRINMDEENDKKGKVNVKNYSGSEYSDNDSGNSSDDEDFDEVKKEEDEDDEDDDDEDEDEDNEEDDEDDDEESKDSDMYKTPVNKKNRIKPTIQYSGSNPVRSCRRDKRNSIYDEMVKSHYLRPAKRICYSEFFNEDNSKDDTDVEKTTVRRQVRNSARKSGLSSKNKSYILISSDEENEDDDDKSAADDDELITEERVCLIDFGLASKFMDNGVHRPFVMDQRRAHDGTLEFTSRDAHMGAHSRRSDLECLGYNLVYWSQGYLPWRDAAAQHQNEKVHWVKEYLMKDVKEMLKHVYGKQVPKYLGEYLEYIGQLAYHERPDYDKCRRIFLREYVSLGYKANDIHLSTEEMLKTSVKVKEEIENNNVIETKNIKSIMKNLNVIMPFHESTLSNRVSPKNLRSKSAKKKSSRKKFSWTEILSQDPDQIARDRAEKEFDRDPIIETPLIRYEGKPTYAILEIQNRLKFKDRIAAFAADGDHSDVEEPPVTHNKPYSMKKRNTLPVISELAPTRNSVNCNGSSNNKAVGGGAGAPPPPPPSSRSTRTKAGLKTSNTTPLVANTTSTKRATESNSNATHLTTKNTPILTDNKKQRRTRRCLIKTGSTGDFTTTDESSCSSINSNSISISTNHQNAVVKIKDIDKSGLTKLKSSRRRKVVNRSDRCSSTDRSSNNSSNVNSDDDTSNFSDHVTLFSPKKKPRATKKQHNNKMLHSAKNSSSSSPTLLENNEDVVGAKRRKRSIPKKRKSSTKDDCSLGEGELDERDLRTFKKRACRG